MKQTGRVEAYGTSGSVLPLPLHNKYGLPMSEPAERRVGWLTRIRMVEPDGSLTYDGTLDFPRLVEKGDIFSLRKLRIR